MLTESQTFPGAVNMGKYFDAKEASTQCVECLDYFLIIIITSQLIPPSLGFLMDVGSRDETHETSGAMLALKNTYLKTSKHTNETMNYNVI